jgi:hypothetical protein
MDGGATAAYRFGDLGSEIVEIDLRPSVSRFDGRWRQPGEDRSADHRCQQVIDPQVERSPVAYLAVITGAFAAQKHDLGGMISRLPLEALRPGLNSRIRRRHRLGAGPKAGTC